MRIMAAKSKRNLILCTWNVRSLVESFGEQMFVQLTVPLRAYAGAYVEEASVGKATLLDTVNFASTHNPSVALLGTAITVVLLWAASRFKVRVIPAH